MIRAAVLALLLALPAAAQQAETANGALLRGLDKVSGEPQDIEISRGGVAIFGGLEILLGDCRYPAGNPSGDAYAYLRIGDRVRREVIFEGWMIASSPALNALDHPRYDVWVLRCRTT